MKKDTLYAVDKHITLAMYYTSGHALNRDQMRAIWSTWKVLKDKRAGSAFWGDKTPIMKLKTINIGDTALLDSVDVADDDILEGGGTYTKWKVARNSQIDCDFYTYHSKVSRCYGLEGPRTYFWTLSQQWLKIIGYKEFPGWLQNQIAIVDSSRPWCGLVDYSFTQDTYAGFAYGSPFNFAAPLTRAIEYYRWLEHWNRGDLVLRGLYWGTYMGNEFLSRLGGREAFQERFRAHIKSISRKMPLHLWEFPNGLFIRLTPNVKNVEPGKRIDGVSSQVFQWLAKALDQYGVIL